MIWMVGIGAGIGSIARLYLLEVAPKIFGQGRNWMVMLINLLAALLMGFLFGLHLNQASSLFWMTGILGGFSTFSAPIVELADGLLEQSQRMGVLLKTGLAFIGGIPILVLGYWLAQILV
ncbi:CrcB family protein [Weissella diestrammenae]|uniref:Fluoride-specific ion channel n=1 Tax=Weissella diestrammenae TaxID=1162633 RepID=A0A7G9T679_9LACO|nr:CrcB family protein [Weissella diestrammenae]MCM0583352.1 CrcB family protein [Weissella diestrammenae]QNN75604.1 CrcB family protein [Weissella diestrammenae]